MTPDAAHDKLIERDRYNLRAQRMLTADEAATLGPDGAAAVPEELRAPYLHYESVIAGLARPGFEVLDVCCGSGLHSLTAARGGAHVTASDFAEKNLELVRRRAARAGLEIATAVADAEHLPFPDRSFDALTCAGSLSYVDLSVFLAEMTRVLRPGGAFVCVDSFNHNPVYRLNRYLHYCLGHRSFSTLKRMPDRHTLAVLRTRFPDLMVRYFGIGSFLLPVIRRLAGRTRAARFSDRLDALLPFARNWSFKIVAYGHLPDHRPPSSSS
jgi:SAM-dependent methyltransferase